MSRVRSTVRLALDIGWPPAIFTSERPGGDLPAAETDRCFGSPPQIAGAERRTLILSAVFCACRWTRSLPLEVGNGSGSGIGIGKARPHAFPDNPTVLTFADGDVLPDPVPEHE